MSGWSVEVKAFLKKKKKKSKVKAATVSCLENRFKEGN